MVGQKTEKVRLALTIVYEQDPTATGSSFDSAGSHGVLSQGRTREEVRENVLDALALMLSPEPVEAGDKRERELLGLAVDKALPGTPRPRADLSGRYVLVEEPSNTSSSLTEIRCSAAAARRSRRSP